MVSLSQYNSSASHSNDERCHQNSSFVDGKNSGNKNSQLLILTLLAAMQGFAVTVKGKTNLMKVKNRTPHHLRSGYFRCVSFAVSQQADGLQLSW